MPIRLIAKATLGQQSGSEQNPVERLAPRHLDALSGEAAHGFRAEELDRVKPARNWVASISEDRRNYTPHTGFEEKLHQKIAEIKGEARLGGGRRHEWPTI